MKDENALNDFDEENFDWEKHLEEFMQRELTPHELERDEARRCEAAHDWKSAEEHYLLSLELATGQVWFQWRVWDILGGLYELLGRNEDKYNAACAELEAARETEMMPLLLMSLQTKSAHMLEQGQIEAAREIANEVLTLSGEERINSLPRALGFIRRAACFIAENNLMSAEEDLLSANDLLLESDEWHAAAGMQSARALWWATQAQLRRKENDLEGYITALEEAVKRRCIVVSQPHVQGPYVENSVAVAFYNLGKAQEEAGRLAEAKEKLENSHSIRQRLKLPPLG